MVVRILTFTRVAGRAVRLYYDPEAQYAGWMKGVYGYDYYPISHQIQRIVNFCKF